MPPPSPSCAWNAKTAFSDPSGRCPDVALVVSTAKDTQIVDLKAAQRERDRTIAALHGELDKLHTAGS
jgi:hypothetical protein